MAIFQSDMTIKMAIEQGLEDIRKNPWLIQDILGTAISTPYLSDKYGQKQIDSCKEWFKNNQIDIYMASRKDRDRLPCIVITLGNSNEKEGMKTMADQSTESIILLPQTISKPIPYVVPPFTGATYNGTTGEMTLPAPITAIPNMAPGMILVNPDTGDGYVINDITPAGVLIQSGLSITINRLAVVPQNQFYKARIEHSFFQETYNISCHVHGDPQTLLWLHSITLYSILRYREGLLENNGFTEGVVSSSDLMVNNNYPGVGGEEVFTRVITLTGQVENSWIKSPRRIIEVVGLNDRPNQIGDGNGGDAPNDGYSGGIKILSNLDTAIEDNNIWTTIEDDEL